MSSRQTFAVLAWHRQFYLFDPDKPCNTDGSEFWSEEAMQSGLAVESGWLGIGTDTDGEVPVTLKVLESEPAASLNAWDRVAEASLDVSSDRLIVAGCPDLEPVVSIPLPTGRVRVRVSSAMPRGRDDPHGVEYRGDRYLIQLWRSEVQDRVVLKSFTRIPLAQRVLMAQAAALVFRALKTSVILVSGRVRAADRTRTAKRTGILGLHSVGAHHVSLAEKNLMRG
jgi:hypothetical protein